MQLQTRLYSFSSNQSPRTSYRENSVLCELSPLRKSRLERKGNQEVATISPSSFSIRSAQLTSLTTQAVPTGSSSGNFAL